MKKLFIFSLGIVFIFNSFTQSDAKATAILNKVKSVYKSYTTIKATFKLTTKPANGAATSSSGTVWIKGSKYKMEYGGQEVYCNGKYTWTYNKAEAEVTKENVNNNRTSITPNEIFTIYNKEFKNAYEGPTTRGGKTYDVIKMVPKRAAQYSYIKLEIDKSTNKISRLIQHFKNGTEVTIEITSMTPNTALADTFFDWDPKAHPGVTEINLAKNLIYKKP